MCFTLRLCIITPLIWLWWFALSDWWRIASFLVVILWNRGESWQNIYLNILRFSYNDTHATWALHSEQFSSPLRHILFRCKYFKFVTVSNFAFFGRCPKTVENFSTHCENGYYNTHIFHRVIHEFMIQTGDPEGQYYQSKEIMNNIRL